MKNSFTTTVLIIAGLGLFLVLPITGCDTSHNSFLGGLPGRPDYDPSPGPIPGPDPGPVNNPPVANAGADQNVIVGDTVALNGKASHDPDGDALSYWWSFQTCPQSICPTLAGSSTDSPSFLAERAGTYVVRLTVSDGFSSSQADTVSVVSSPVAPSEPGLLQMQWQYGIYGTSIGQAGLLASDLDGDGTPEIIASDFGSFWYIVRKTTGGSYEQIWRSENYSVTLARIVTADLTGDGKDDIIVGLSDGIVQIFDGPTRQKIHTFTLAAPLVALSVGDLDQNGAKEIVTSSGTGISVYTSGTGDLVWSNPSGGGYSIAVGNVDGDAALEIVTTTSGGAGYVIDGISHVIEWGYVNSFGARVGLGDLDGDGMQEIVGAAAWYKITIFNADLRSPSREIATSHDIGSLLVADAEADGVPEIIYGDGQWGEIHAINAQTGVDKWSVSNPEHGVSGIALGDVDADGKKEVLWGAGGTSSGPDYLYVADPGAGTIEWQSKHLDPWLSPLSVGDVDDDGQDEIVMVSASSDSGYAEGIISIFNAATHALEYQKELGIMDWMGVRSVRIGDVDNDGKTEFVVTTGNVYDGVIQVYDGASHTLKKQSIGYSGNYFTALAIGDVDGDGKTEIVAGQGREHTGAAGVYLIVFDGTWLTEKWRSVDLGTYWGSVYDIKLADLDGDGHTEIVASVSNSRLIIYDGVSHAQKLLLDHPARALEIKDSDGDSALEILVGREDGKIDVFNGSTYAIEKTVVTYDSAPINALRLVDLDGNGALDWLVTRGNTLVVLEGQDPSLKWRSPDLSDNAGLYNHIGVKDIDNDGKPDVFLGANYAIYQFD